MTCDFQQCGILTSVDSDEPVQPPFQLRNSKCCSVSIIFKWQAKALIRLRVCAGWSEPLLVAHTTLLKISCQGSFNLIYYMLNRVLTWFIKHIKSVLIFVKNIRIYYECEGSIEKSVPRVAVCHHEACFFYLKISFQTSLNNLRYNFTWWLHFNITMSDVTWRQCAWVPIQPMYVAFTWQPG